MLSLWLLFDSGMEGAPNFRDELLFQDDLNTLNLFLPMLHLLDLLKFFSITCVLFDVCRALALKGIRTSI